MVHRFCDETLSAFLQGWACPDFVLLGLATALGLIIGVLERNPLLVFGDGNAYLFLLYLLPILSVHWNAKLKGELRKSWRLEPSGFPRFHFCFTSSLTLAKACCKPCIIFSRSAYRGDYEFKRCVPRVHPEPSLQLFSVSYCCRLPLLQKIVDG